MRIRCSKGKSCGATCIQRIKLCLIEVIDKISSSIGKLRDVVKNRISPKPLSYEEKLRKDSMNFDKGFEAEIRRGKIKQWGDKGFDWSKHLSSSKFGGKGSYGTVFVSEDTVVKRGEIGRTEASIQSILSKKGLAPKILSYEFTDKPTVSILKPVIGRIAMERAKGRSMDEFDSPDQKIGNKTVSDAYWSTRAKVHRSGIAHNDLHTGNIFLNPETGKTTVLDFGFSQRNPKAALSEALGAFSRKESYGDYQVKRTDEFPNIGYTLDRNKMGRSLGRIADNLPNVVNFLLDKGLSKSDIKEMIDSPTMETTGTYLRRELWGKLSNKDAMSAIKILYEGV